MDFLTNFLACFTWANFVAVMLMLGILSILIIVHEFGHFSVARFFGFQTPVFGIGLPFGPSWIVGSKWDTQFKIHALLLGGYVAIPELGDESTLAHEAYGVPLKPFHKFPIWQRALVAVAGVTMNVIFAYVVMVVLVAMMGVPVDKVYVNELPEKMPIAREAGVKVGDRINTLDGIKISKREQVIEYLQSHKAKEVTLGILREPEELKGTPEGEAKATVVEIKATTNADGKLGMGLDSPRVKLPMTPLEIAGDAYTELSDLTVQMVSALGNMMHSIAFGWLEHHEPGKAPKAGLGDLHGVIVVVKWGAEIAQEDWTKLFTFTALISMDLAIVNLLPIPALDGGHLFFMLMEAIRGKPMNERIHGELVKWGFISLLALMALITVNDIRAWVTGELDFKKKKEQKIEKKTDPPEKSDAKSETDKSQNAPDSVESSKGSTEGTAPDSVGSSKLHAEAASEPAESSKANAETPVSDPAKVPAASPR